MGTTPGPNYNSALYQPSQTLSGKALGQAAGQIASLQTQGPISQLAAQIAKDRAQGTAAQGQTFGYYQQLARDAQTAMGQQSGINSGLQSQLQGIGTGTQQQLAQLGQQAQGGAVGRAAALGLDGGSQGMLGGETARQQGLGALNSQAFQQAGASQGANYAGHAASEGQTIALRGQERLGDIGRATQLSVAPLNQKIADLRDKTGALTATALGQLRSSERNYQVANAGLGIKQNTLKLTAANDQAKNALGYANIAQSNLNNLRTTGTSAANNAAGNSTRLLVAQLGRQAKSGKQATPAQSNAIYSHVDYLAGSLQQLISKGINPKDAYHLLQNGGRIQTGTNSSGQPTYKTYQPNKFGASVLNAAYNSRSGGTGLSPGDVAWFKSMGISNPRYAKMGNPFSNTSSLTHPF